MLRILNLFALFFLFKKTIMIFSRIKMRIYLTPFLTILIILLICPVSALAQPFAYVANNSDDNISVIDIATNTEVLPRIPVGFRPRQIAITPDGTQAYVTNTGTGANSVSVIDTATNMVVATIPVGQGPQGIAITPDGTRAYVSNSVDDNTVSVIDTATNMVVATIPVGTSPRGIAITPDGTRAYVVNFFNNVSVINTATNMVITSIPLSPGANKFAIAITPDGARAYVTNGNNDISVIDTATNMVVATIPVENSPRAIAITPDGTRAYVANFGSANVSVINTMTNVVDETIVGFLGPQGIAITPDGTRAYVTNSSSDNVSVINTATNMVVGLPIPVGNDPQGVTIATINLPSTFINLTPNTATNDVLTEHTVTATIDRNEMPEPGILVSFEVISGPNAGEISDPNNGECSPNVDCTTDENGQVSWTYTGSKFPGTDTIVASFFDEGTEEEIESNTVVKIWVIPPKNVPTLSEWGLIFLAAILGIVGFMVLRRRIVVA